MAFRAGTGTFETMNLPAPQLRTFGSWSGSSQSPLVIAGPCSAESLDQVMQTAKALKAGGQTQLFRAGVWKPRTRPGQFEGIGYDALGWLQQMRAEVGLPFVIEVANAAHVEKALAVKADAVWIGARTTVNPFYVQEIAEALRGSHVPVLVKNPIHADLGLWLGALERLEKVGSTELAAVHRGFFSSHAAPYRNEPKWELSFELRRQAPNIPIICDPSHIAGNRALVEQVAQVAMDIQIDGLMIEVHPTPDEALSDAAQQITPERLRVLLQILAANAPRNSALQEVIDAERLKLDEVDRAMVDLLRQRMDIVEALGHLKVQHGVGIFQMDRWFDLLQQRGEQAETLHLNRAFVEELFQTVHKYSVEQQLRLYDASRKNREE